MKRTIVDPDSECPGCAGHPGEDGEWKSCDVSDGRHLWILEHEEGGTNFMQCDWCEYFTPGVFDDFWGPPVRRKRDV